ncbi:MAG: hypothetical protein ABEI97_05005 [Candidatus Nanohaloarchaea archaeon]
MAGAFDVLEQFFAEEPPVDGGIAFYGINGVTRDGVEAPPAGLSGEEAIEYYERNVPDELKGPVNYMMFVTDNPGYPTALETSPSPGGKAGSAARIDGDAEDRHRYLAFFTLHELYWHGLTDRPHINQGNPDTISSPPYTGEDGDSNVPVSETELEFLDEEWSIIFDAMDAQNREYFTPVADELPAA